MYKKKPHNSQKQGVHLSTVHHFFFITLLQTNFPGEVKAKDHLHAVTQTCLCQSDRWTKEIPGRPSFYVINKSFFKGSCIHYNNCQQVSVSYLFQTPPAYDYVKHNMFCGKLTWKFCYRQLLTSYHMEKSVYSPNHHCFLLYRTSNNISHIFSTLIKIMIFKLSIIISFIITSKF